MRLKDKSSHVRKKAIELLVAFMDTSPFIAFPEEDMGSLSQKRFETRVDSLLQVLRVIAIAYAGKNTNRFIDGAC